MRQKKAKAIRRALGFRPHDVREYAPKDERSPEVRKSHMTPEGVKFYWVTGTLVAKGARGAYQRVKRAPVITGLVLKAAMMEVANASN